MMTVLKYAALTGAFAGAATAGIKEDIPAVPSGQVISLQELLLDVKPDGVLTYARFRFVTPEIGATRTYADVESDFAFLCTEYALPIVKEGTAKVDQIVISFASQPVEFGVADPDTTQFFEAFRVEDGACIWEEF